ncbi:MAG: cytidine deaminase [Ruminococcus sp.]|nr:cytidine deaminase [Ruminococcus sp.]
MTKQELCTLAIKSMNNAYSPYSGYKVGAALLCDNGKVFTGCNVENSSYGATVCAERTAIFKAVSDGERDFSMLAVAGGKENELSDKFLPCGICRQVMAEFCKPEFIVLVVTSENTYKEFSLSELLPNAFSL